MEITAANNSLSSLPFSFFHIESLRHLNFASNAITSFLSGQESGHCQADDDDGPVLHCFSLKSLNLANNKLTSIPLAIHAANSLEKLQLNNNQLTSFPRGWKCPLVCVGSLVTFDVESENCFIQVHHPLYN